MHACVCAAHGRGYEQKCCFQLLTSVLSAGAAAVRCSAINIRQKVDTEDTLLSALERRRQAFIKRKKNVKNRAADVRDEGG